MKKNPDSLNIIIVIRGLITAVCHNVWLKIFIACFMVQAATMWLV